VLHVEVPLPASIGEAIEVEAYDLESR
jgi:hypothetical protein